MKKLSIIAYLIVLTFFVMVVFPIGTQAGTLLDENFDTYATGYPPVPPWTERYYGWGGVPSYTREQAATLGVTIQVDDTIYNGSSGKSVHFLDTSTGAGSGLGSDLFQGLPQTSYIVLEYYMQTGNQNYEGAFVTLRGDVGTDYRVCFSNGGYGGLAGYIGVHGGSGGWIKPDLLPYTENTWYYVRRELDCATNTGSFYVEEVDDPSNSASYSIGSNYENNYIDHLLIFTSNSAGADCYIDGLRITSPCGIENYNWLPYKGHYYACTLTRGNWEEVQAEAESIGANLVTINDASENNWLTTSFADACQHPVHPVVWIGLLKAGGEWSWASGEPFDYEPEWCTWCFGYSTGTHAYLHTGEHDFPGTWNNNSWHDTGVRDFDYLYGIIEISDVCECEVTLSIGDSNAGPGETDVSVEVGLINLNDEVRGVQVDVCDDGDHLTCTGCVAEDTRAPSFRCSTNEREDGCCRVVLVSDNGFLIDEGTGTILTIRYDVSEDAPGDCADLTPVNVKVSDEMEDPLPVCIEPGEFCFSLCGDIAPDGDPCGDFVVNIIDVLEAIDITLDKGLHSDCQLTKANVPNGLPESQGTGCREPNGEIDIFDILVIIDVVLEKPNCCDYITEDTTPPEPPPGIIIIQ